MLRRSHDDWKVSIHRNLGSVELEWRSFLDLNPRAVAVLHTGFERPATEDVADVIAPLSGRLVLTDAAVLALPRGHTVLGQCLGQVDDMRLHVAAAGWGYIEESVASEDSNVAVKSSLGEDHLFCDEYYSKPDWFAWLENEDIDIARAAREHGVVDEATYLQSEPVLPDHVREPLGWQRYLYYVGLMPDANSLIYNLRFAPGWLLDKNIATLSLSVRSMNALGALGARKIRDLEGPGRDGLRGINNLGAKSVAEVSAELIEAFVQGPWISRTPEVLQTISSRRESAGAPDPGTRANAGPKNDKRTKDLSRVDSEPNESAVALIEGCLEFARPQHREILQSRMGFGGETKTLEEIGQALGRTRERVRQIEAKAISRVGAMRSWHSALKARLNSILDQSTFPVPLHGLEVLDPWFRGIDDKRLPFSFALKHFCGGQFSLINVEGEIVVTRLSSSAWSDAVSKAREIVAGMVGRGLSETQVRLAIEGLLPAEARELREPFWRESTKLAHFANASEERELISYGGSVEHAVQAVLAEADTPLHYIEIAARCSERLGRRVDPRRAHSASANVALLFGRGTFGLERHFPFKEGELEAIVSAAEDVITSHGEGRQWHARELASILEEDYPDISLNLDPYIVSIALSTSNELVSLGRMVWASRSSGLKGVANRIDVRQAVIALLQQEGRPMSTSEIQSRLSQERGLSRNFQIHHGDPLLRVAPGIWGLVSRDIPYPADQVNLIVDTLVNELTLREKGIHSSEIAEILERSIPNFVLEHDPMLIIDIARRSDAVSLARGQIIFLTEWNEPRRFTLVQAVKQVLEESREHGLTTAQVHAAVEKLVERPIDRATLPAICDDFAILDQAGRWRLAPEEEAPATAEEI